MMMSNRFVRFISNSNGQLCRTFAGPSCERIGMTYNHCNGRQLHSSNRINGAWDGKLSQARLNRYLVIAEDFPNPGALARRLEVRDVHMDEVRKGAEVGRVELAGGLLSKDFEEIDENDSPVHSLCGSAFVIQAESLEEVKQRVLQDDYVQAGAWDPTSIKIFPFLPAFFQPQAQRSSVKEQMDEISKRTPRGISQNRGKITRRNEVFVKDPRISGAALNKEDRATISSSLSELRRTNGERTGPKKATLNNLRKHAVPPMYNDGA